MSGSPVFVESAGTILVQTAVDRNSVVPGDIFTYTITYTVDSENIAGVRIENPVPSGTIFVEGSATSGGNFDGIKIIWDMGNLSAGASGTLTFQVRVR